MLEMIIKRKWYLQKHLDAPLLKEREDYLEIMAQKGIVRSSLLSMADYLLLIVNMLSMADEQPRKITPRRLWISRPMVTGPSVYSPPTFRMQRAGISWWLAVFWAASTASSKTLAAVSSSSIFNL